MAEELSPLPGLGREGSPAPLCVPVCLRPPLLRLLLCGCLARRSSVLLGQSLRSLVSLAVPVPSCVPLK